jgi:hypothetical protein
MNQIFSQSQNFFLNILKTLQGSVGGIGTPKLDYPWLIILFVVFVIFLVGFGLGRSRMMISLISLYIASFLEVHFVYFNNISGILKNIPPHVMHIGFLLIIYGVVFFLLNRSFIKQRLTLKEASIFVAALMAILQIGFMASIMISYLPAVSTAVFPQWVLLIFGTKNAQFLWALTPIIVLIFMKSEKKLKPTPL